jgi:multidrug resistance efflux pump
MEELKSFIITNWPTIIEYALMLVAYFLVFLYKSNVSSTKKNIDIAFSQFATRFADNETNNKTILDKCITYYTSALDTCKTDYAAALNESKAAYEAAVNEIAEYKKRTARLEDTLAILLSEDLDIDELNEEVSDV